MRQFYVAMNWNKYPFLRILIPLGVGILLRNAFDSDGPSQTVSFFVLLGLVALEWLLHRLLKSYRYRWVFGVLNLLAFVMLGYLRSTMVEADAAADYYCNMIQEEGWYVARVLEPPVEKDKSVKVPLALQGFYRNGAVFNVSGKLMGYLEKTETALNLQYGDLIAFSGQVEEIPPPKNPEEFDYKRYLERQGVTGKVYRKENQWHRVGTGAGSPFFAVAYRVRDRLLEALRNSGITEEEFGVGAAILLGYDESLPAQVRQNYVAAGSMHVLCVSGMHVGIIYMLAAFVLRLLGTGKRMQALRRWLLLGLLWLYAMVAGWSPSILRATLMISFVLVGELIHRKGFALNSIAASAFLLLVANPNNLFSIGFQLSYAAVTGILLLQRPIYNLVFIRNKLLDRVWEITAVSISAQLATMPFTVYYFNQFTPYFWLSNLFMTPLSFVVILSGMLLLLVSWIPSFNLMVGKVVWWGLRLMNLSVAWVERLPGSLVKGLSLSDAQFVMCLLLFVLLLLFVNLRKKRMAMELLIVSAFLALSMADRSWQVSRQSQLVVYSLDRHTAIDLVNGSSHVLLCDKELLSEASAIDYSLKGYWAKAQLSMNPTCYTLEEDMSVWMAEKRGRFLSFEGKLLAFWQADAPSDGFRKLPVDYLLVRGKQRPDVQRVTDLYEVGLLLIDGTVPEYLARDWINQAERLGVPCYSIRNKALVINIL